MIARSGRFAYNPTVPEEALSTKKVLTVAELSRHIKSLLEDHIKFVWVAGQVSRVTYAQSGHLYFDLKDEEDPNAVIAVTMWRPRAMRLRFKLETGMSVLVFGLVTAYAAQGKYQISAEEIEPKGVGALHLKFEQLKEKLAKEGLFEQARKRPLPMLPSTIALVTSPVGAAVQDMIRTIVTRFPKVAILVYPVKVQGEGAAEEIAAAIGHLNLARPDVDVMVVGRGGGSIEDLWAFNEEVVARAVFASRIPVVSAVGHETDYTISDFVADVRALTPTDAGNRVVPRLEDLELTLREDDAKLRRALRQQADLARSRLDGLANSRALRRPEDLVAQQRQRLDELAERLRAALPHGVAQSRERCAALEPRLGSSMERVRDAARAKARALEAALAALDPRAVLARGYSITMREDGTVLRDAAQVKPGEMIVTDLAKGRLTSHVLRPTSRHGDAGRGT
ncbi:MAG: exodeoxyribonuclease VII large subunit [Planctomycetes bacterium]|nr:exodeoxyribonuclease VII large subunit [Planctomycetota bacterium]